MAGKDGKKGKGKQPGNQGPTNKPEAKGNKKGGKQNPASEEDKMRNVSGGGTRGVDPRPSGSGSKGDKVDELVTWTEGVDPFWVVSVLESTEPEWLDSQSMGDSRCAAWKHWATLLNEKEPSEALVFKHLMSPDAEADTEITRALLKVLSIGRMPRIDEDAAYDGMLDCWKRREGAKMLEDAKGIHHRYVGADSALMAPPLAIWPPPIELVTPGCEVAEGASCCWEVRFNRTPLREELMQLARTSQAEPAEWKGTTWFRKADVQGRPTSTWFLKALAIDVSSRVNKEFAVGPDDNKLVGTAIWAPQCAFCLERPGGIGTHDHHQCPLVGTLNKIRQQGELKHLRFSSDGTLVREDEKTDLDVPLEVRALKSLVARFELRLEALEKAGSNTVAGEALGKGKKRKPSGDAPKDAPAAKKTKGGGSGGKGKPPAGGQNAGGKGGKGSGSAGGPAAHSTWE